MFLIVGAGFLGTYLIRQLSAQFRGPILATVRDTASVVPFPKTEYVAFDVTDETDVRRLAKRCGGGKLTVFYFAALHNVDYLYTHREEGENVNLTALARFLDAVPGIEKFFSRLRTVFTARMRPEARNSKRRTNANRSTFTERRSLKRRKSYARTVSQL